MKWNLGDALIALCVILLCVAFVGAEPPYRESSTTPKVEPLPVKPMLKATDPTPTPPPTQPTVTYVLTQSNRRFDTWIGTDGSMMTVDKRVRRHPVRAVIHVVKLGKCG